MPHAVAKDDVRLYFEEAGSGTPIIFLHEFELVNQTLAIGSARAKVVKRITRCAAVNVDPDTAERDLAIPQALQRRLGHGDCGIYAEVIDGGSIAVGDAIAIEQAALL